MKALRPEVERPRDVTLLLQVFPRGVDDVQWKYHDFAFYDFNTTALLEHTLAFVVRDIHERRPREPEGITYGSQNL